MTFFQVDKPTDFKTSQCDVSVTCDCVDYLKRVADPALPHTDFPKKETKRT